MQHLNNENLSHAVWILPNIQWHPIELFLKISVLQANVCWLGDLDKIVCPWKESDAGKLEILGVWGDLMCRVATSDSSRGGAQHPAPPPPSLPIFRPNCGPKGWNSIIFFGDWAPPLSKGLDDQPPLISRSGAGTSCYVLSVRNLLALPPPRGDCSP